jgi:hypothetical protein
MISPHRHVRNPARPLFQSPTSVHSNTPCRIISLVFSCLYKNSAMPGFPVLNNNNITIGYLCLREERESAFQKYSRIPELFSVNRSTSCQRADSKLVSVRKRLFFPDSSLLSKFNPPVSEVRDSEILDICLRLNSSSASIHEKISRFRMETNCIQNGVLIEVCHGGEPWPGKLISPSMETKNLAML